ncbi:MAG: HAMP domain-containing histidine kinase [Clostridia bacterium]|nr:HAMP domain-containing histidine kinase [Clostridia bacterium]
MHRFNKVSGGVHGRLSRMLSNFRLSLTFRIALHYAMQLLRTTLSVLLIFSLVYWAAQYPGLRRTVDTIASLEPGADGIYESHVIQQTGVYAVLQDVPYPDTLAERVRAHAAAAIVDDLILHHPYPLTLLANKDGYTLRVTIHLDERVSIWGWLTLGLLAADLMRIIHFMRHKNRLNKSVLAPIRDITDMAATLSGNNLSNRINIAGTKNELKDLAVVINTMLDRIERSYNSQKQFVSDASHELRTPIAVIQGYVNMLSRWGKDDPSVLDEGIAAIAQETASMKELVESLLFLARHDKKTLMMEMEHFDPCEVIHELHREASMVTPEDTFLMEPMENCMIEADRGMIKQVMRILCDNAVKYTPKGGRIVMGVQRRPGGCTLSLSDNGPGIAPEEMQKIFERFYRSDSARKSDNGGHGLGLSIARIIVIAHGGKLRVRSRLGEGSTFYVDLPEQQTST